MLTLEQFNQIRGAHFAATPANIELIDRLNSYNATEEEIAALPYSKPFPRGFHELRQACADIKKARKGAGQPAPVKRSASPAPVKPQPQPIPEATATTAASAEDLIKALRGIMIPPTLDAEQIKKIVDAAIAEKAEALRPVQRIEIKTPKTTNVIQGLTHKQFEKVVDVIACGDSVYMVGPAGSGKSVLAEQVAQALGLDYYYSGQLSQEYNFCGFTDANGRYQATPFYNAWTKGGLFFLDEMDRSFPEVLTKLNGALANGIFDFPAPIGTLKKHENFRCIAAGNTIGRGATGQYTAANALDASSLDRFIPLDIEYDKRIEDAIDREAADFVRVLRKPAALAGLDIVLSYRTITKLARYSARPAWTVKDIVKSVICSALTRDDINSLTRDSKLQALAQNGNKYAAALLAA